MRDADRVARPRERGSSSARIGLAVGPALAVVLGGCLAAPAGLPGREGLAGGWSPGGSSCLGGGTAGFEAGIYSFRTDLFKENTDEGRYFGVRYTREIGLNAAMSVAAGVHSVRVNAPADEVVRLCPVRATVELGSLLGHTLSRWYVGAGGGFYFAADAPGPGEPWPSHLPYFDDEWGFHAVFGFVFRNESIMTTRAEIGHTWLPETEAHLWTQTVALSFQF